MNWKSRAVFNSFKVYTKYDGNLLIKGVHLGAPNRGSGPPSFEHFDKFWQVCMEKGVSHYRYIVRVHRAGDAGTLAGSCSGHLTPC